MCLPERQTDNNHTHRRCAGVCVHQRSQNSVCALTKQLSGTCKRWFCSSLFHSRTWDKWCPLLSWAFELCLQMPSCDSCPPCSGFEAFITMHSWYTHALHKVGPSHSVASFVLVCSTWHNLTMPATTIVTLWHLEQNKNAHRILRWNNPYEKICCTKNPLLALIINTYTPLSHKQLQSSLSR